MATKPLQQDEQGRIMGDTETANTQKGYSNYEKELENKQKQLDAEDAKMVETARKVKEKIKSVLPFKSGGYVRSADGIAKRGKTRGKIC